MRFVARSIFWLGMVYSSIPLDFGSLFSDRAADANPLAACVQGPMETCRQRMGELRKAVKAAAALGVEGPWVTAADGAVSKDLEPPRRPVQGRTN
jgi:hypothetical protein